MQMNNLWHIKCISIQKSSSVMDLCGFKTTIFSLQIPGTFKEQTQEKQ